MGVALGVILGAIMQLVVSLIGLFGFGFDYDFKIHWRNQGFRTILRLLPPRSLDQGIDYINSIVSTNLSSRMGAGAVRSYDQATSLHTMPVNLIGVAISTAFFPKLTDELGGGDREKFNETFRQALRTIIWIALPISVIVFFTRGYIVSFISNIGNNDSNSTMASILGTLCVAVFAKSVFHIATRGFYAFQDTKTPFRVSIVAIGATIGLMVLFTFLDWGVDGLGIAQSIGSLFEVVILLVILQKRSRGALMDKAFWKGVYRMAIASAVAGCVAFSLTKFMPLMATDNSLVITIPKFLLITALSMIAYLVASYFLNLKEVQPVFRYLKKKLFKNVK